MKRKRRQSAGRIAVLALGIAGAMQGAGNEVAAFTQGAGALGSGGTPMGHEWVTTLAGLELLEPSRVLADDPRNRPAPGQSVARARNATVPTDALALLSGRRLSRSSTREKYYIDTYGMDYHNILAAIVGERWVDIGGFNVTKSAANKLIGRPDCWNSIAQVPNDLQHDHFCREREEAGGEGGIRAATDSARRLQEYFVAAAMAPDGDVLTWDGGITSAEATVDRRFFLLGRTVHLLQDSFSGEHAVRQGADGFQKVQGIKTYLCSLNSDQHSHSAPLAPLQQFDSELYTRNGDVIWMSSANNWTPTNMKGNALAAVEATKDLFAAFLRTLAVPRNRRGQVATAEARLLAGYWMSFEPEVIRARYAPGGPAQTEANSTYVTDQAACDVTIGGAPVLEKIERDRQQCFANIQATDANGSAVTPRAVDMDPHLKIPFHWGWKSLFWQ
jgi:hypothetical protein